MFLKYESVIQNKVIKTLCEDVNKIARVVALKELAKVNKCLKIETGKTLLLKKIGTDDDNFEIPPLDIEGANKYDFILLN